MYDIKRLTIVIYGLIHAETGSLIAWLEHESCLYIMLDLHEPYFSSLDDNVDILEKVKNLAVDFPHTQYILNQCVETLRGDRVDGLHSGLHKIAIQLPEKEEDIDLFETAIDKLYITGK